MGKTGTPPQSETRPSEPLTKAEKLKRLPWNIAFITTNSIAIRLTFLGSIFVLYLSELGINKTLLGTILSLLPFLNILSIFVAPRIARIGVRKVFLLSFTIRYLVWALIVFSPWVRSRFGQDVMVVGIIGIVIVFALLRMLNMVSILPWNQEFIPASIRGKFFAKRMVFANLANIVTVTLAGFFIESSEGILAFNVLFLIGVIFGLISAWEAWHFPGGGPKQLKKSERSVLRSIFQPLKDRNYRRFSLGIGAIILAESLFSFVVLYMREEIGLSSGNVVLLQTGSLVGGAVTSYLWGWAADRFGSKPVLQVNMLLIALLPVLWFAMPYQSSISLYAALGIAFIQGSAQMGRFIGGSRLLYNRMVPPKKSTSYMAFYNAWMGLVMGVSQLFGGVLLDAVSGVSGRLWRFPINSYSVMFGLLLLFSLFALFATAFVRTEGEVSMGEFVGMFFRGNPLLAMETLISFNRPRTERAAINLTERLGLAQSHLTNEELLSSLQDPRFYVRYEAIVSIARHKPHPQLTDSLIEILEGKDPALSVISAWALGRIGDPGAIEALRRALTSSDYRSVRAHSARSLAALGDEAIIPCLVKLYRQEKDRGLQQAYAAALGHLEVEETFEDIYHLLEKSRFENDQMELALALGRLIGDEDDFIQISRQLQDDFSTSISRIISSLKLESVDSIDSAALQQCALIFAQDQQQEGVEKLLRIAQQAVESTSAIKAKKLVARLSSTLIAQKPLRRDLVTLLIFTLIEIDAGKAK
jgi:MFS family permease